ncbi:MAG: transporter related protein [Bryobacterales bacterium]|nr:transporter related protein [Bryobacterales bacterium]
MSLLSVDISAEYAPGRRVLRGVNFVMEPGEVLGLVGQSGSGKSTLAMALLRLLGMRGGRVSGSIRLDGRELTGLSEREMRSIRGRQIGFVPQSPASALNPALRVRTHLEEAWRAHARGPGSFRKLLESVSLPSDEDFLKRYPAQLSVGQGQRFLIAMGILHRPLLLIADEPTSALDVITQAEILSLFARLNRDLGMALLYISHDLLSIASLCHRVAILHEGEVVEIGAAEQIFRDPRHAYTRELVRAIPRNPYAC